MQFNSLEEALAYIRESVASTMPEIAQEIKIIMDDTTIDQVTGWTDQIFDSVVPEADGTTAMASFKDTGHWESAVTGKEVGNPIKFLEAGSTWNRGASDIIDTSFELSQEIIPQKLKEYLMALGIPIE